MKRQQGEREKKPQLTKSLRLYLLFIYVHGWTYIYPLTAWIYDECWDRNESASSSSSFSSISFPVSRISLPPILVVVISQRSELLASCPIGVV